MTVKTYKIRAKVILKSSDPKRKGEEIDLTPYVKEIRTNKGLHDSAGDFHFNLLPFVNEKGFSWYYTVSPMDYVEISFSRDYEEPLEVVMRGFVDSVRLTSFVDPDGKPQRFYSVTGQDFGKMLDITRIYYLKEIMADLPLLALPGWMRLEEKYGWKITGSPVELIKLLLGITQNQIQFLQNRCASIPQMKYLASDSILGEINSFSMTQEDGSIWEFMQYLNNAPWNELYAMDFKDAPYLVFRKTPWKDLHGEYIQGSDSTYSKSLPETYLMEKSDIVSIDIGRTDAEVKNYFFTFPVAYLATGETSFKAAMLDGADTEEDLKSNPYVISRLDRDAGLYRFGFRRFENVAEYLDVEDLGLSKELCQTLNENLVKAFRANSAYENGTMELKGSHKIKAGNYISLQNQAGLIAEYYVTSVSHALNFTEGAERFTTSVEVTRGTGYLLTRDMANFGAEKLPYEKK